MSVAHAGAGATLPAALAHLEGDPRLAAVLSVPARPGRTASLARPLPDRVRALAEQPFWAHQAAAIDLVRDGAHTVVATGTASGKSRCFQVPIAEAVTTPSDGATALLIYPTKALAQDQLRALGQLGFPELLAATVDGDASPEERTWARNSARVVLTNPEMLHHGLLAHHRRWSRLFRNLTHVVVDELHLLRGMFGGHVANVLRRLRRVAALYGAHPTFVFTSATLGRPGELAEALLGEPVEVVDEDASPTGPRTVVVWNPRAAPDDAQPQSLTEATARLGAALVAGGHRTLAFTRSRKGVELAWARMCQLLEPADAALVHPYRAGYLTEERRQIEAELFAGELRGVVATSALELGIDVGSLDAVICGGFPGTVASFHQQIGRAGRGTEPSTAVLVCGEDQLDQWLARHPYDLLDRVPEPAVVNPDNPYALYPHLLCAAHEYPLRPADDRYWPGRLDEAVTHLARSGDLSVRRRGRGEGREVVATWAGTRWPFSLIGLRSAEPSEVEIRCGDGLVGTVGAARAPETVHEGAIYLHRGRAWRVTELDLDARVATVIDDPGDTYTLARTEADVRLLERPEGRPLPGGRVQVAPVLVTSRVTGYQRRAVGSHDNLGTVPLDLPPSELETRAVVFTWGDDLAPTLSGDRLPGALHAAEHGAIGLLGLFAVCDRWDVGGLSTAHHTDTGAPTVLIHDGYPGGAGIAELAERIAERHLAATRRAIAECPCDDGCPSCVQSPKCGNLNEPLDKAGAQVALGALLGPGDL
ncbi:MAG: DEAD/DEAH box helicase [Microthrixaceae bacterium]